jgi:DNA-binding NarL/FixJ family response regulator
MMRIEKIRLVIADGQPAVLTGLQAWFEARGRYCIAASAKSAGQLLAQIEEATGDVIIIGDALGDSHEVLRALRERHPHTPVVVLTSEFDPRTLLAMQHAGARGIASTRDELRELGKMCDRVLSGAEGVVSRRIAGFLQATDERVVRQAFHANAVYGRVRTRARPFSAIT